jgi:hypothetical protein
MKKSSEFHDAHGVSISINDTTSETAVYGSCPGETVSITTSRTWGIAETKSEWPPTEEDDHEAAS